MYAETDLDQPTDYSLRYAENDSEPAKPAKPEYDDAVKTYCTEDTPYETPLAFSAATSLSDLRLDDKKPARAAKPASGLVSPEKPVSYCDEGTPSSLSRAPSCDRLAPPAEPFARPRPPRLRLEKAVTFGEVSCADTPLMFSRSSSLASLDSVEQHSIHDDRSSVVSDFSRLASGVVSPSELPDSPTQARPTFAKAKADPKVSVFEDDIKKFKTESTPLQFSTATSLSSLLLDEPTLPDRADLLQLSDNKLGKEIGDDLAHLSDSDDEEDILAECINIGMQNNRYNQKLATSPGQKAENLGMKAPKSNCLDFEKSDKSEETSDSLKSYYTEDTPAILSHAGSNSDLSVIIEDCKMNEEGDEDILDAQIDANISSSTKQNQFYRENQVERKKVNEVVPEEVKVDNNRGGDSVRNYFTEDTPAILSHAGSNSDLSVLSIPGGTGTQDKDFVFDLNSTLSDEDDDDLLTECVQFGMASLNLNSTITKSDNDDRKLNNYLNLDSTAAKPPNVDLNISIESNASEIDNESALASDSDSDSYESEQALLRECIAAGMPARAVRRAPSSNDLSDGEKALLQQCILEGMRTCALQAPAAGGESAELTAAEKALLRQCIIAGMPRNRNLAAGGPSGARDAAELSGEERALLQQCIVAGMPGGRARRPAPRRREEAHSCCVHCPKYQRSLLAGRQGGGSRARRKARAYERGGQGRDNGNFYNNQIMVERSHEEWV